LIRARPRFRDASERAVSRIGIRAEAFSVSARAMLRAPSRATPSRVVAARSNRHRRRHRVGARASARETPKNGERVTLHYKMTLNDGTVIDDTRSDARQGQPVTITLGDDSLFARIGEELATMTPGDVRENVTLAAKDAFGERDDAKVQRFPLSPEEAQSMASQVQVGQLVQLPDGARALCLGLDGESVTLDLNHPLAGQDLCFELELVSIAEGLNIFGTPMVSFTPPQPASR
jgi:FKBP-type peptidyl-prolyl cis-trans isomerase 2|tara:strand:+ start:5593 stop:6291 length:699 start_codon:yes stop_codon:yes gene_type:complete